MKDVNNKNNNAKSNDLKIKVLNPSCIKTGTCSRSGSQEQPC